MTELRAKNAERWEAAVLKNPKEGDEVAFKALANQSSYKDIAARSDVSWLFIACAHYRECGQNFHLSLAQGDPWKHVSRHVPAGRGPFKCFEDAAVDALTRCAPFACRNSDWSIPGLLTLLERYNGLGYAERGVPSPYIWSGTDQYVEGKYVRDGVYDPRFVDQELGCAALLLAMHKIDGSIYLDASTTTWSPKPVKDALWLQKSLNTLGEDPPLVTDGISGMQTRGAIRAFQASHDLDVDGIAGPLTIAAIDTALAAA
ncbi:MAG TPA: peptidoglycan-binding protein [Methylocella sp.]|nr:peptidoglycan-binding protein [Methylocella sp.]